MNQVAEKFAAEGAEEKAPDRTVRVDETLRETPIGNEQHESLAGQTPETLAAAYQSEATAVIARNGNAPLKAVANIQ